MLTLVVNLFRRSRLKPRFCLREPLGSDRTGPNQPLGRAESHPLPARVVNRPPQVEVRHQQPREVLPTFPQEGEEQVIVPGLTGMKCTCARPRVESLSLQGLPI